MHNINLVKSLMVLSVLDSQRKIAICCNSISDVHVLGEHGYRNCIHQLASQLSLTAFMALRQAEVTVLVYFTNTSNVSFDIEEAEYFSTQCGIRLCEVNLPFSFFEVDTWDGFQWRLFDKRLTSALKILGCRNERYQA